MFRDMLQQVIAPVMQRLNNLEGNTYEQSDSEMESETEYIPVSDAKGKGGKPKRIAVKGVFGKQPRKQAAAKPAIDEDEH